ncbi:MAG: hypothetical protein Q8Q88_23670 [Phenylobacterium sp.]|uniref:hypothetical protein n=1 Tax=Phenylobacterium sp. TaxID=1871053 RepID=UPI0027361BE6|nr:hypothetical protein [Phenylobacterium sp.]MDP3750036.1 hypothetical protein [Phenylobacterium sp.]
MREGGALGPDCPVETTAGTREFAAGDRVTFLRNERSLGVKNGSLGQVETISDRALRVRLDDGRRVDVELKTYGDLDHGYATTIHKSQGVTVDRGHVLASAHMDRHATYVALSRHRQDVVLHYDRETFATSQRLAQTLGRERAKDTTLDYAEPFASRRGLAVESAGSGRGGVFGSFTPGSKPQEPPPPETSLPALTRDFARAHAEIARMHGSDLPVLPHQQLALERASHALDRERPRLGKAMSGSAKAEPGLVDKARDADPRPLLQAAEAARQGGGKLGPESGARPNAGCGRLAASRPCRSGAPGDPSRALGRHDGLLQRDRRPGAVGRGSPNA